MKTFGKLLTLALALMLLISGCGDEIVAEPSPSPSPTATTPPVSYAPPVDGVVMYSGPHLVEVEAPEDDLFGLMSPTYYLEGNTTSFILGEVAGDTDKLNLLKIRATYNGTAVLRDHRLEFVFDAQFPVIFTAKHFVDGEEVSDGGVKAADSKGFVEKYGETGRWSWTNTPLLTTPFVRLPNGGKPEYDPTVTDLARLSEENTVWFKPFLNPGVYRYTLYFRECIDYTVEGLTTGEELYKITFIVTVPVTEKQYDLIAISEFFDHPIAYGPHKGENGYAATVTLRKNFGSLLEGIGYNWSRGGKVEMKDGDEWVEVEDGFAGSGEKAENGRDVTNTSFGDNLLLTFGIFNIYLPDPDAEYRITATLSDERYKNYDFVFYVNSTDQ